MSKLKRKLKSLLVFDALVIGAMYTVNRVISSSAIIKNILNPVTGDYYNWKFGDVFYRVIGSGSPVLLVHDLNSISSGFEWNQIELKLSKNHTVYTVDLLGCGRSDKPALTYTNYFYVQMISDFIKDVIGEKTDIVVTGISSSFVTMSAAFYPEIINRIISINPPSFSKLNQTPDRRSKIIRGIMSIPVIGTSIYNIKTCRQNIEYILTEKYMFNPFHVQQKYVDAYYEAAHRGHGGGKYLMASLDGFYLTANIRRALESLKNPIYLLYGDKLENEREVVENYKKMNDFISVRAVSDVKMLPQLENPEKTYAIIENILEEKDTPLRG